MISLRGGVAMEEIDSITNSMDISPEQTPGDSKG